MIDNHIIKIEKFIKKRINFTAQFFSDYLDPKVKYSILKGGFNFWLILPESINTANILFEDTYNKGVTFLSGAICYPSELSHNEIRLSIGYLNDEDHKNAIKEFCKIINKRLKNK